MTEINQTQAQKQAQAQEQESKRLQWQCRRGMLELDILLAHFLAQVYPQQPEPVQKAFAQLLTYPDSVLFDCLLRGQTPEDQALESIIKLVRLSHVSN